MELCTEVQVNITVTLYSHDLKMQQPVLSNELLKKIVISSEHYSYLLIYTSRIDIIRRSILHSKILIYLLCCCCLCQIL